MLFVPLAVVTNTFWIAVAVELRLLFVVDDARVLGRLNNSRVCWRSNGALDATLPSRALKVDKAFDENAEPQGWREDTEANVSAVILGLPSVAIG